MTLGDLLSQLSGLDPNATVYYENSHLTINDSGQVRRVPLNVMSNLTPPIQSITCPRCAMTSWNQTDVQVKYCGNCHMYHENMNLTNNGFNKTCNHQGCIDTCEHPSASDPFDKNPTFGDQDFRSS